MDRNQDYIELFRENEAMLGKASSSFMRTIRQDAMVSFSRTGIPSLSGLAT